MAFHPRRLLTIATLVAFLMPAFAAAQESARRRGATAPPSAKQNLTPANLEYYLTDEGIAYIRPGLKIKVNSITIGSDRKPVVELTLTDDMDQPVDRLGKTTPGVISISMILAAYDPATRHYTSYTTRTQTTPVTSPRPGVSAVQASADSGGAWTDLQTGRAKYVFRTALPAGFDQTKTHTLGIYSTRNLTEQIGKNYYANVEYDFRPDGEKIVDMWDKVRDASSCLNCHDPLSAHGGSRRDVKLCVMCHNPQTVDPDTGLSMDFKVLVHKIHFGPNLPSVKAGKPYLIIGNQQSVHDYSHTTYPQDVRNCDNCHEGTASTKPTQASVFYTKPNSDACGACHDDVNFQTGENHPGGAVATKDGCASCHIPDSGQEFDTSILGAHVIPGKSKQLKGITATVVSVTDLAAGKKPTVVFSIKNGDGTTVDGSKLTTFAPMVAGATSSYSKTIRESAVGKATFDPATGNSTYTFSAALPDDAKGTWTVTADVYRNATLKRADGGADITMREAAMNPIKYVALSGSLTPRRTVVLTSNCNQCHDRLAMHGGQRMNVEECVICHNPLATDAARRPAAEGLPESISMQRMIHRIHKGERLTQEYTVFGFGNSKHTFNEVLFPGDLRNCAKCHAGNSYRLPLQPGIANVNALRDYFSPQGPGTASCLGCHDNKDAAAHAYLNTTTFGGTDTAEACATCHGTGKDWDVAKAHAR